MLHKHPKLTRFPATPNARGTTSLGKTNDRITHHTTEGRLGETTATDLRHLTQGPHALNRTATVDTGATADLTTAIPPTTSGPTRHTADNHPDNQHSSASPNVDKPATHASPQKCMTSWTVTP